MSNTNKPTSPLRQRMIEDMTLRKLSERTQTQYIRGVVRLTTYLGRSPDTATLKIYVSFNCTWPRRVSPTSPSTPH